MNVFKRLIERFKPKMEFELDAYGDLSAYNFDTLNVYLIGKYKLTINREVYEDSKFVATWENNSTILSILYENDGSYVTILEQGWK